jgi:cyclopropane fatty-acyl-phospholipid synthase-like methyltransferase
MDTKNMHYDQNYVSRYYTNQHLLRGIKEEDDVQKLLEAESKFYDKLLLPILRSLPQPKIVELACGPGIFMRYLKQKGFDNSLGVELADGYVEICHSQCLKIVKADVFDWLKQQPESSIDVIVAIDFIEHINKQTFVELLDLVSYTLAPGGIFIARAPSGDSPFMGQNFYNDITHETVFTTTAMNALLKMCNLSLLKSVDEFPVRILARKPWVYPLVMFSRYVAEKIILLSTGYLIKNLSPNSWIFATKQLV